MKNKQIDEIKENTESNAIGLWLALALPLFMFGCVGTIELNEKLDRMENTIDRIERDTTSIQNDTATLDFRSTVSYCHSLSDGSYTHCH